MANEDNKTAVSDKSLTIEEDNGLDPNQPVEVRLKHLERIFELALQQH